MAKRKVTTLPELEVQLLEAIDKATDRIDSERERLFDACSLVEILSRAFHKDEEDPIRRACKCIYAELDVVAGALEVIRLELEQAANLHKGDADATEVSHG